MLLARLILSMAVGAAATAGMAQDSLLLRDYSFVKQADPWLTSGNAAGLTRLATRNMAEAELSLTKANGGLTDFYASPNSLQLNAAIESFYRLSSRTVVFGAISYNNFSGRNMAGSTFIIPEHKPFDIIENNTDNTGTKHRDTYRLTGAVGTTLFKNLSGGLQLDYTAANYAKYKDLRHKNMLLDMTFAAGVYWSASQVFQVGADYQYRRSTESLSFRTYGSSDKVYESFINYGPYIGKVEQFGTTGYTDKSHEMPLVDNYHGGALQLTVHTAPLTFYNSAEYAHRTGYYGRRSPYTISYSAHRSNVYKDHARLTYRSTTMLHALDFSLAIENLQNEANTFRELQNDNGANYYEYYDPVKTANRLWADWSLTYTAQLGIRHELPTWTLQAGFAHNLRKQTAYQYPYYRRQQLSANTLFAAATRNLLTRHGVWTLSLDMAYRKGTGDPFSDQTFATPSEKQTAPATMDTYLYRDYRYFTAPQLSVGGSVKYAFLLPATKLRLHVKAAAGYRTTNETNEYCDGNHHTQATLAVGCCF